jgi:hypothetical protein
MPRRRATIRLRKKSRVGGNRRSPDTRVRPQPARYRLSAGFRKNTERFINPAIK